jgi:tripartite-type tricarboxylate transporter receptor subunit TctC
MFSPRSSQFLLRQQPVQYELILLQGVLALLHARRLVAMRRTPLSAFAHAMAVGAGADHRSLRSGGTIDITARLMATRLSQAWGQAVVVENRGGAAGTIGANIVAKATPDGHTLLLAAASELTIAQTIIRNMPFDALTDFTPIALVARSPFVLVVNSKVPATNVAELIALAKRQPGKLNYGTSGAGTTTHLVAELFNSAAGVQISHIPYKGSGLMMNDLVGGQLDMAFDTIATTNPHVQAGNSPRHRRHVAPHACRPRRTYPHSMSKA